jgi:hypothetical protein
VRKARSLLPPRVTEALAQFGSTLYKVERGDPGVGLGVYARVLYSYGMLERLEALVDARWMPCLAEVVASRPVPISFQQCLTEVTEPSSSRSV